MPSKELDNTIEKLAKDFVEADKKYHELLGNFVQGGDLKPGPAITTPKKVVTEAALEELNRLESEVTHARAKWHEAVRKHLKA
jgi:hypothetical protein